MSRFALTASLLLALPTLAHAQRSAAARLSRPIEYWNPDWFPDGKSIVFESTESGQYSIYSIRADGTALTRLTQDTANNEQPRWSPDGKRIVFSSDRASAHLDIHVMNADGSGVTRLTTLPGGGYYQSSFSPDGRWIVFQGRPDNAAARDRVYIVASDGSQLRQLSDSSYGAEGPRWSPDGRTISYLEVPYPKRLWSEMGPADMTAAHAAERLMTIRPDGSGLAPAAPRPRVAIAEVPDDASASPDGTQFAYSKTAAGFAGLYIYHVATRRERLVAGGAGAGPLGYLRTATLTAATDTLETFMSARGSNDVQRGNGAVVAQSQRRVGGRRWEVVSTWYDSAGTVTARQAVRTAAGSLATEVETVRATTDSASLLIARDRVTGWVVPHGKGPQLFDADATGERYSAAMIVAGIAQAKPAVGAVFVAPVGSLYGGNPAELRVDSIRVVRRDTLYRGTTPIPVLVLERASGSQLWVDDRTGVEVLSRGNAGPERWWWHIRRGVSAPR